MRAKAIIMAFVAIIWITNGVSQADLIFSDDFESGTLDQWTIDGRQSGTNLANVVERSGSLMGHLYHKYFTEITMANEFDYVPNMTFRFDMEVHAGSGAGPTSAFYSLGGVYFTFLDSEDNRLGWVGYVYSTSNYELVTYNPYPEYEVIMIPDQGLHSYSLTAGDILSNITIDTDLISSVDMKYWAYASASSYNMWAEVWVDNVEVTGDTTVVPVPPAVLLGIVGFMSVAGIKLRKYA